MMDTHRTVRPPQAGERHGDAARPRRLAGIVGVDAVARRLVEGPDQPIEVAGDLPAGENGLLMLGPQGLRGPAGRLGFRIGGFLEDDRERLESGASHPCHEGHDAGGVQSAGEKSPHGHVGNAMRPHGVIEPPAQFAGKILRGGADGGRLGRGR